MYSTEPDTSAFVRRMFDQFENNYEMAKQADGRFVELQRRKIQVIEVAYLNFFIGHVRACKEKNQILI